MATDTPGHPPGSGPAHPETVKFTDADADPIVGVPSSPGCWSGASWNGKTTAFERPLFTSRFVAVTISIEGDGVDVVENDASHPKTTSAAIATAKNTPIFWRRASVTARSCGGAK